MKSSNLRTLLVTSFVLMAFALAVHAQAAIDLFSAPRYIQLSSLTDLTNHSGTLSASNQPVDIHGYEGIATVVFFATNYAGTTGSPAMYAYLESSDDKTNWFAFTNAAAATAATYNLTNLSNGTVATNTYFLPGTVTTATPASAGFAGSYLVPAAFNSGSGTLITNVAGGVAVLGFNIQDAHRYVHVAYKVTGSDVAFQASGILIARKQFGP